MAKHLQRDQTTQACSLLDSFAKKTQQQSGKKLSPAQSLDLTDKAVRLAPALGC